MKLKYFADAEIRKERKESGYKGRVVIGEAEGARNFYMRVMEISKPGAPHPPHTHEWEHEVFIHSGQGEIFGNGKWSPFKAGDVIFIPGKEEHGFRNTGEEPLIFVCCIPSGYGEL
jgi:quercetin dioxygenase-like cupin family protein